MGDTVGIWGFRGREKPNIKQIVKKKRSKNFKNSAKSGKKSEKSDFFYWKWSKMHKEPHETPLKVRNLSKKTYNRRNSEKIGKIVFFTENGVKCIRNPTKHL